MRIQVSSFKCYARSLLCPAGVAKGPSVQPERPVSNLGSYRVFLILGPVLLGILTLGACGPDLEPAPDFRFSLYQGEEVLGAKELSLSDLRGKPLVLNFWAGLCPPCRLEMPTSRNSITSSETGLTFSDWTWVPSPVLAPTARVWICLRRCTSGIRPGSLWMGKL